MNGFKYRGNVIHCSDQKYGVFTCQMESVTSREHPHAGFPGMYKPRGGPLSVSLPLLCSR